MPTLGEEVSRLTGAAQDLLNVVNVKKLALETSAGEAAISAASAESSKVAAQGSANAAAVSAQEADNDRINTQAALAAALIAQAGSETAETNSLASATASATSAGESAASAANAAFSEANALEYWTNIETQVSIPMLDMASAIITTQEMIIDYHALV